MANKTPCFFYAPSWDYPPPPLGPIRLGNVLSSLQNPESALFTAEVHLPPPPPPPSTVVDGGNDCATGSSSSAGTVFSSCKRDVQISAEKSQQGKFSVLTQFLSVLGVGVDVGANWDRSDNETLTFDTITTTQFIPGPTYIQEKCIDASPRVQRWLERSHYRKPLYLITGLKIVSGSKKSGKTDITRAGGGNISVTVDGTVWSGGTVPVSGTPELEINNSKKAGVSWGDSEDFVLAYRVKRFKVARKTRQVVKEDDYVKGSKLGNEIGVDKKKEAAALHVLVVEEEEDGFVDDGDEVWQGIHVAEGDEDVAVAVPRVEKGE